MTREPLPDDLAAIRRADAALDDPYAALSQHLHGDGERTISDDEIRQLLALGRPGGGLEWSVMSAAPDLQSALRQTLTRALAAEAEVERLRAATGKEVMPDASTRPIQQPDTSPRLTAGAHHACTTPGCTNPPAIRLDDLRLCRDCYATHDFGDDA